VNLTLEKSKALINSTSKKIELRQNRPSIGIYIFRKNRNVFFVFQQWTCQHKRIKPVIIYWITFLNYKIITDLLTDKNYKIIDLTISN